MKRIAPVLLAVSLMVACNNKQDDLNKDISIPVSINELKLKPIEKYVETSASVSPVKEVSLKNEVAGLYKVAINPRTGTAYKLGDKVVEGESIVVLEDKEYRNNIKIEGTKLNLEISKQTFDKQKSLYEKGGVTLSEFKKAEVDYINAKYSYEDALIRLGKLEIKAPFSGQIVELPYHTANTKVNANELMVRLMDYSQLQMEIKLAEKNLPLIKVNQKVRITNYTLPDDTLHAVITQKSPAIDTDTRSFKAVLQINNINLLLSPGMFAKAEIIVDAKDSALVIPKDIILAKQRGNTVFIVEKNQAKEKIVSFGLENPKEVQITDGIKAGDRIVIKGFETLRNNSKVKIVK